MNKNARKEKEFDTVKFFRTVKEKISKETKGMTFSNAETQRKSMSGIKPASE